MSFHNNRYGICSCVILGLDSAQPLHHIAGLFKPSLGDELVMKSLVRNVQVYHDFLHFA